MTKFSLICSVSNGTECYSKKGLMNSWSILYTVPATSDKNPQYGKKLHTFRQVCQINKNPWILRIRGFLFIWQTCLQVFSYFFHISDFVFCHRTVSIKKRAMQKKKIRLKVERKWSLEMHYIKPLQVLKYLLIARLSRKFSEIKILQLQPLGPIRAHWN